MRGEEVGAIWKAGTRLSVRPEVFSRNEDAGEPDAFATSCVIQKSRPCFLNKIPSERPTAGWQQRRRTPGIQK